MLNLWDIAAIDHHAHNLLNPSAVNRYPYTAAFTDLRLSNPLYLRSLLEDKRLENAPIVLLHAAYPYSQEAGYLASVYPQVYLDFGLAVPFLSQAGMCRTVQQLLELTPTSKLMYSSDAHNIPELYYLGAKWGREVLSQVLDGAIQDGDLTAKEAESVAREILCENARKLYLKSSSVGGHNKS